MCKIGNYSWKIIQQAIKSASAYRSCIIQHWYAVVSGIFMVPIRYTFYFTFALFLIVPLSTGLKINNQTYCSKNHRTLSILDVPSIHDLDLQDQTILLCKH